MKFTQVTAAASIFAVMLFVESCKKDDVKVTTPSGCLVVSESETGTSGDETELFTYNSDNTLASTTLSSGSNTATFVLTYNSAGQIIKSSSTDGSFYSTSSYDANGRLTQSLTYLNSTNVGKKNYIYNDAGQTIRIDSYGQYNNDVELILLTHETFTYNSTTTFNPATESDYVDGSSGNSTLSAVYTIEYDTHKAPVSSSTTIGAVTNNVTKVITKDKDGNVVDTGTYTYEYNAEDYPTKQTFTSTGNANGTVAQNTVTIVTYKCE